MGGETDRIRQSTGNHSNPTQGTQKGANSAWREKLLDGRPFRTRRRPLSGPLNGSFTVAGTSARGPSERAAITDDDSALGVCIEASAFGILRLLCSVHKR